MKEWCLKHPFLTFLLLDKAICAIDALFRGVRRISLSERIIDGASDAINDIIDAKEAKKEKEGKQPIGFIAS